MRNAVAIAVFISFLAGSWLTRVRAAANDVGYQLVVNAANPVTEVAREDVSRIFLKKSTTWPSRQPAFPVDQRTDSLCRRAFSKAVLGMETREAVAYWNQMIFSGRASPPPTKASDSDVLAHVRGDPNAIGYVGGDAVVGEGVKVLKLRD